MTHPLVILMQLNNITQDLDKAQAQINFARNSEPMNPIVQLELDRKQEALDLRRTQVELALFANASLN